MRIFTMLPLVRPHRGSSPLRIRICGRPHILSGVRENLTLAIISVEFSKVYTNLDGLYRRSILCQDRTELVKLAERPRTLLAWWSFFIAA